jgi:hydrogenase maturation protein HypF
MCPDCQREYDDPANRRFHAQPNACPTCGPQARLTDAAGDEVAVGDGAVRLAAHQLANGHIVAVKGVGGYHLMVDATNESAVAELRRRKHRAEKPFAVMFRHLAALEKYAEVPAEAARLLLSAAAPIVLVRRYRDASLAPSFAPGNPWIGALLPSTPLHVLLLEAVKHPVVATSANLAEEPLCADVAEAHAKLAGIADFFLDHDRPIAHPVDDSVVRLAHDAPVILRRARGYAPLPLRLPAALAGHWFCAGAQMKGALAVAAGRQLVLSPHIGDLDGAATFDVYRRTAEVLRALHGEEFTAVACDKHPDYASTRVARQMGLPTVAVQHHLAHVLACLLENKKKADAVLGIAWDGTGYGEDGTVWGGEFILLEKNLARRFARVRPFRLAGGDAAVREPRRVALGLLHEMGDERFGELAADFDLRDAAAAVIERMLTRGLNSPVTSSAGRLFDAVGALLGLGLKNQFEGQTPLAVEAAAVAARGTHLALPLPLRDVAAGGGAVCELDWQPLVEKILSYRALGGDAGALAASFHHALARAMVEVARRASVGTVALTGGCFQNTLLLDLAVTELRSAGFTVLTHRELPPNDGNIAVGQALGALWNLTDVLLP